MASIFVSQFDSPIGRMLAAAYNERLVKIALPAEGDESFYHWLRTRFPQDIVEGRSDTTLDKLRDQLSAYFERRLQKFDLPLELCGTHFQKRVWTELLHVTYGQVISYGELARRLNKTLQASRAIGAANGANPLPIVVPCHRVVGHNGKLVGYGGGLETKAWLLSLEARQEPLPFACVLSPEDSAHKAGSPDKPRRHSATTG
jgi:methylated-DNA-[protein]-cysteine S-methyltransferase